MKIPTMRAKLAKEGVLVTKRWAPKSGDGRWRWIADRREIRKFSGRPEQVA
jgi:hypothetical protein